MASVGISNTAQKSEFHARLARIQSGAASSKSTLYVGLDETILVSNKANAKLKKHAAKAPRKPLGPMGVLLCVVMGAAALALALYLRFYLTGGTGAVTNPDIDMAINGGIGFALLLFTGFMLNMPLVKLIPSGGIGLLAAIVAFHNLVHFYPEKFSEVFSPIWVEQVVGSTDPNSIIWRGKSFVL